MAKRYIDAINCCFIPREEYEVRVIEEPEEVFMISGTFDNDTYVETWWDVSTNPRVKASCSYEAGDITRHMKPEFFGPDSSIFTNWEYVCLKSLHMPMWKFCEIINTEDYELNNYIKDIVNDMYFSLYQAASIC